MARVRLRLDTRHFDADQRRALRRLPQVATDFLRIEQLQTYRESQNEVPRDQGNLAGSGSTPPIIRRGTRFIAEIVYSAAYALRVHENPRAGKTGGRSPSGARYRSWARVGKWKYLEHPMMRAEIGFARRMHAFFHARLWRR